MKRGEIKLRDPFVLPYEGKYYLYGTRSETAFVGQAYGFDVYMSDNLFESKRGTALCPVFRIPGPAFCQKVFVPKLCDRWPLPAAHTG